MPARKTSRWPVRGVMVDPARLIERHEFYFDLLERLAEAGLNTLWWHFTDDQGFMLRLRSHPELASPHAFTRAETRRLLAAADRAGIDVVPEVESLGHARCITALKRYAELGDGDPLAFNALCPSHPRTLPLLREIILEVADLFPSRYFHAGMDEVNLGSCPRCRRRGAGRPTWWVYARHLCAVHEIVRSAGKEMIVWGDHVERDPEMLKVLPKDVILAHWQYGEIRPAAIRRSLRAGFRVIGCPALCHWGDVIMPNADNYRNMDAMATALGRLAPQPAVLGVVNTWWTSWRGLRDAYLPAVAYTGAMLRDRGPVDKVAFLRRFLRQRFGITGASAGRSLWQLQQDMPKRAELHACLFDSAGQAAEALLLARLPATVARAARVARTADALKRAAGTARRNRTGYAALVLAGEVAAACLRRPERLARAMEHFRRGQHLHDHGHPAEHVLAELTAAVGVLRDMQRDLAGPLRRVAGEWDRTRYRDDHRRGVGGSWRGSGDALLVRLDKAQRFMQALLNRLERSAGDYPATQAFPLGV